MLGAWLQPSGDTQPSAQERIRAGVRDVPAITQVNVAASLQRSASDADN